MPTWVRATAETMPWVTVWPTPNGSPIASTTSPTCSSSELANSSVGKRSLDALDAQHGEIAALVLEHDVGWEFALVGERDLDVAGALDDVIIGDDEARRVDQDAGAERALHHLPRHAAAAEELAEERVGHERILVLDHVAGVDVDHRRRHALHHRRIGQLELSGRSRHLALLGAGGRQQGRDEETSRDSRNERTQHAKTPIQCGFI